MSPELTTERLLRDLEESLLRSDIRVSERVSQLLAEEFVEFGSSGKVFSKAQVIAALQIEKPVRITVSAFKIQMFAPHAALVTYRARRHSDPAVFSLRSSMWERRKGQWQMVFHQGTTLIPDGL